MVSSSIDTAAKCEEVPVSAALVHVLPSTSPFDAATTGAWESAADGGGRALLLATGPAFSSIGVGTSPLGRQLLRRPLLYGRLSQLRHSRPRFHRRHHLTQIADRTHHYEMLLARVNKEKGALLCVLCNCLFVSLLCFLFPLVVL